VFRHVVLSSFHAALNANAPYRREANCELFPPVLCSIFMPRDGISRKNARGQMGLRFRFVAKKVRAICEQLHVLYVTTAATNAHATIQQLFDASFSVSRTSC
jgi:hypothetical protein